MENQVLSSPLCKRFKKLGIEIKTHFVWIKVREFYSQRDGIFMNLGEKYKLYTRKTIEAYKNDYSIRSDAYKTMLPAPTLSELLEIVPTRILDNGWSWFELGKTYFNSDIVYWVHYTNGITNIYNEDDKSPIEAVGKLLIYLKENNLI